MQNRFERTGSMTDLDEAMESKRAAVAATPADHPDRAGRLNNLGLALQNRFERTGSMTDLDEAVESKRAAVAATPADHPDRAMYLNNLGNVLRIRFERAGTVTDLDEAVETGRAAVAGTPVDHLDRAGRLNNLGLALRDRFERTGMMTDLDEAAAAWEETLRLDVAAPSRRIRAARNAAGPNIRHLAELRFAEGFGSGVAVGLRCRPSRARVRRMPLPVF
ncbi:tetratricopeptide repeat protein [Nocardia sp. NPDC004604]|uniref:tetratricopeptide repeat protein n=1 Tax=Nocardia sp. NPDC004604 TaxID=3157013 RepID=UPI0033B1E588